MINSTPDELQSLKQQITQIEKDIDTSRSNRGE